MNTRQIINTMPRETAADLLEEYGYSVSRLDDQEIRDQLRDAFETGQICAANIQHAAGA